MVRPSRATRPATDERSMRRMGWLYRVIVHDWIVACTRRDMLHGSVLEQPHHGHVRLAQIRRDIDDRVEHRLQLGGGSADDLQHLAGCLLERQRFLQIARPRLHFFEQPGIFDGDDRLVGKGLDQIDLFLGERLDFRTAPARARRSDFPRASAARPALSETKPGSSNSRNVYSGSASTSTTCTSLTVEQCPPDHGAASGRQALVLDVLPANR